MRFSGLVRDFDRQRTCNCQHPGCQHVGTTCTPTDRISAATLQKPYKPWLVIQQLWFFRTVSNVMGLSIA